MSNGNPYESPATPVTGVKSGQYEDLRSVARYQKGIIACILVQLVALVGLGITTPDLRPLVQIILIPISLASTVFIFLLAIKVYGTVTGILLGIMALIPCVGLLVLLTVNGKATRVLRENGYHVGFLGARLSEFD